MDIVIAVNIHTAKTGNIMFKTFLNSYKHNAYFLAPLLVSMFLTFGYSNDKTTIAIVSFDNLTDDNSLDWLERGISESVTTDLLLMDKFVVIERMKIDNVIQEQKLTLSGLIEESGATKVGELIGAESIILGSYQIINNSIRINCRLINTESGNIMRAAKVDGSFDSIFSLQDELVLDLFPSITKSLETVTIINIKKAPTKSVAAYELYSKALNAKSDGDTEEAISLLHECLGIDGAYIPALKQLGAILFLNENYREAASTFRKVLDIDPINASALFMLAQLSEEDSNFHDATQYYEKLSRVTHSDHISPVCGPFEYKTMNNYTNSKAYPKAIEYGISKLRTREINNGDIFINSIIYDLLESYFYTNQFNNARLCIDILNKQLDANKTIEGEVDLIKENMLSTSNFIKGKASDDILESQLVAFDLWCDANYSGKSEQILLLKRSIQADDKFSRSYVTLARIFFDNKNYPDAIRKFYDVTRLDPDNWSIWQELGYCLEITGDRMSAETCYTRSLQGFEDQFKGGTNHVKGRFLARMLLVKLIYFDNENMQEKQKNESYALKLLEEAEVISPKLSQKSGVQQYRKIIESGR